MGNNTQAATLQYVKRLEKLQDDAAVQIESVKEALKEDKAGLLEEIAKDGFDPKLIKRLVAGRAAQRKAGKFVEELEQYGVQIEMFS